MNYGGAGLDQKQDIGVDETVVFQTVNAKVQLKDSQGNLLSGGTVREGFAPGYRFEPYVTQEQFNIFNGDFDNNGE